MDSRICVDPKNLKEEHYLLSQLDDILSRLNGKNIYNIGCPELFLSKRRFQLPKTAPYYTEGRIKISEIAIANVSYILYVHIG